MSEYTIKDVIIDPEDPRVVGVFGKKVYYGDNPYDLLYNIKKNDTKLGTLESISKSKICDSFNIKEDEYFAHQCIIIKKEDQKTEYVPFESADEFLNAYENSKYDVINVTTEKKLISCGGIWLKSKCETNWITQCTEVSAHGIVLGLSHEFILWKDLLDGYRFLDGTPCGKLKE